MTPLTDTAPAPRTRGRAADLLDAYRPGDGAFFFASPTRTLLTEGPHRAVPHGHAPLADRVEAALDAAARGGHPRPVVVGAVPFAPEAPAQLAVPAAVRSAPALHEEFAHGAALPQPAAVDWRVRAEPRPEEYERAVAEAVRRMTAGELEKVVLARTLRLTAPASVDIPPMLRGLAARDPRGYTFAAPAGGGRTLIGASPELLVRRDGRRITVNPLAGSAPRSGDLTEDVRRAAALLDSAKDRHEHAVVVEGVRAALAPLCRNLRIPDEPSLVQTAALWHLSTTVTAEPADASVSALRLAMALHPTPAVCGTPTAAARELIGELEPFDRGLFTGVVGWGDADGDGEWVVTIRCGEVDGSEVRLYAGAGLVPASRPEAELAETDAKFRTFLQAAGVAPRQGRGELRA